MDVKGKGSLEKGLDAYVAGELMEGDNAYFCESVSSSFGRGFIAVESLECLKALKPLF